MCMMKHNIMICIKRCRIKMCYRLMTLAAAIQMRLAGNGDSDGRCQELKLLNDIFRLVAVVGGGG